MRVLTPQAVVQIEQDAFREGVSADSLMETAGLGMADAIRQFFPNPGVCLAVFGKGHNGGDALVTARILSERGWKTLLFPAFPSDQLAPLTAQKWDAAGRCETPPLQALESWTPDPSVPLILLDGLLGVGAKGPLQGQILGACKAINSLRQRSHARVFALDLPTGLNALTGQIHSEDAVVADFTLTVAFGKTGLLADQAIRNVGRIALIPLPPLSKRSEPDAEQEIATPLNLSPLWKRRSNDLHKGDCGRVALVAGGLGCLGAAALCARGALRSGAGLVTLWIPEPLYSAAAPIMPAECMVRPYQHLSEVLDSHPDALAVGPGIGVDHPRQILTLIRDFPGPAVLDADALTILSQHPGNLLHHCEGPRLLTPHPGEMERMVPGALQKSRKDVVLEFTRRHPVTLLLKGARTLVGTAGKPLSYNTTGNPGMASGGMGDVLTGVCAGLLAQGVDCHDAARLGAWLCGRSAEAVIASNQRSEESLLASDVADSLGQAFESLRSSAF